MFFKLTSKWLLGFFYHHQNLASALDLYLLLPTQLSFVPIHFKAQKPSKAQYMAQTKPYSTKPKIQGPKNKPYSNIYKQKVLG